MPDIFISYSSKDKPLARAIFQSAESVGLSSLLAEFSLKPGDDWKDKVLEQLEESEWVLFLATPNSCTSSAVMHEIGAALVLRKSFVPVRLGAPVEELPDWIRDGHAVDGSDQGAMRSLFEEIAKKIKANKVKAGLVLGAIAFGVWLMNRE